MSYEKKGSLAKSFTDLVAWQRAHQFVLDIYKLTAGFPKSELYGLTSQIRRAAVSIPANIAEGFRRRSDSDTVKFLNYAQGSLEECRYYMILVSDLKYATTEKLSLQLERISKVLNGYTNAIRKKLK